MRCKSVYSSLDLHDAAISGSRARHTSPDETKLTTKMKTMRNWATSGSSMVEMVLIIVCIALLAVASVATVGQGTNGLFVTIGNALSSAGTDGIPPSDEWPGGVGGGEGEGG